MGEWDPEMLKCSAECLKYWQEICEEQGVDVKMPFGNMYFCCHLNILSMKNLFVKCLPHCNFKNFAPFWCAILAYGEQFSRYPAMGYFHDITVLG
jgi:hypothetical protein